MSATKHRIIVCLCLLLSLVTGATSAASDSPFIVVQSTTSTQNSGLLDNILPRFKADTGIEVRVVAVGTGQAIKNAINGDGDILLVHSRQAEEAFVADGWGVKRYNVMYNDFVLVGPADDPANLQSSINITDALTTIARTKSVFVSRADDSGTHKAELRLWEIAGIDAQADSGTWYRETGSGMGATLNVGLAMGAYVLTDRATWIAFGNRGSHKIVVQGDKRLFNQYGIILVNPQRHPAVKSEQGQAFIDWITSDQGQQAINSYKIDGQQLFFANANEH